MNGMEVRWVTEAEPCPDCVRLAGKSWCLVSDDSFEGVYPGDGSTVCQEYQECKCHLEYRRR